MTELVDLADYDLTEPDDVRTAALTAAVTAVENFTTDATGGARYNARRVYDRGFDHACRVLRHVEPEHEPAGLITEVDAVVRDLAEGDLTPADARGRIDTPEDF